MDPNARVVNTITAMRYLRTFDDDGLDLLMVGMIFEMARRRHEMPQDASSSEPEVGNAPSS